MENPRFCISKMPRATNAFIQKASEIQTYLTAQSLFSTVAPTPVEVSAMLDQMRAIQLECSQKNYRFVDVRNDIQKEVSQMLKRQCTAVNGIANGDTNLLILSGFELNKVREPRPAPTQGGTPKVLHLGSGQVILSCKGIKFQDFYELEVDGPAGLCNHYNGNYARFKVSDLPLGVALKARMRGINSKGQGQWTESLTFIVYGSAQHGTSEVAA